ncbi:MAG: hypothetical protein IPK19_18710 [Chloroflexi bacterium]|nr:hypothetical protein [Chloroflexota bacterium]
MLADFAGTILIVSHDRYLIDALATQIWSASVEPTGGALGYSRGYQEYLAAKAARRRRSGSPHRGIRGQRADRLQTATRPTPAALTPYAAGVSASRRWRGRSTRWRANWPTSAATWTPASAAGDADKVRTAKFKRLRKPRPLSTSDDRVGVAGGLRAKKD